MTVSSLVMVQSPGLCTAGPPLVTRCRDAIRRAGGEAVLESFLKDVNSDWETRQLTLVPFRGNTVSLIGGWEELLGALEDHRSGLASMRGSPYYEPFQEEATAWETSLGQLTRVLDLWQQVQRRWVHLSAVFPESGSDVAAALPGEARRFREVSREFLGLCAGVQSNPLALSLTRSKALDRKLERLLDAQQRLQSALGEYLERQRLAFPRLFFVGDDDVLDVISSGCRPARLQRHLPRMFTGVAGASASHPDGETADATALAAPGADVGPTTVTVLTSPQGETLPLVAGAVTETSAPHVWLASLEQTMRSSLAQLTWGAFNAVPAGLFAPT